MGSLGSKTTYNAYYGDFRGVDFSSDHTQVNKQRLAYAVNMYKDYQSGQGRALETIPGFRRRVELPDAPTIYGIHQIRVREGESTATRVLIHAGNKLYHWHNYPLSINIQIRETIILPEGVTDSTSGLTTFEVDLADNVYAIKGLSKVTGEAIQSYAVDNRVLRIYSSEFLSGDRIYITYVEGEIQQPLYVGMTESKSSSFIFNNRLYLIDGNNYLVYDGNTVGSVLDNTYIPTTYINIIPSGENADIGKEYEQRNILQPKFKHTFIADGSTKDFYMNERDLEEISEIKLYGEVTTAYTVNLEEGKVSFNSAPEKPQDKGYTEFYAGIEITAKKTLTSVSGVTEQMDNIYELITECTIACAFDNRMFFSGNPAYPNHVFYCGRNITGYVDPTYFGVYNYMQDGVGITPITGIIPVADSLMVLKGDTQQDGSVFFHTPTQTDSDLTPVVYPSTQGLNGIGCLGACTNFLDDPVFVSRLGLEGIGQYTSAKYERAIEHRSTLIDAKLVNENLKNAMLEEWNGYLVLLVDGKIYLADSRQKFAGDTGTAEYEWYYLEGIGIYTNQYQEYRYSPRLYEELAGVKVKWCRNCKKKNGACICAGEGKESDIEEIPLSDAGAVYYAEVDETYDLRDTAVNSPDNEGNSTVEVYDDLVEFKTFDDDGNESSYFTLVNYVVHELKDGVTGEFIKYEAFLCESKGNKTGGIFCPAVMIKSMDSNLFFGTDGGIICSFNFDMRDEEGTIASRYYNFDERTIVSGCATRMDNCNVPHLTKSTVKKSTVIKTKSMQTSAVKIRVRTNKKAYNQIARINSTLFSFDNMDFSDFSFITNEQSLFAVKEKEKKWVEKQYYIYSDEYMKPFALFYVCYRYTIAGRYKE